MKTHKKERETLAPKARSRISLIIFSEIVIGMILSFFSLVIFIDIASDILEKEVIALDVAISYALYSLRNPLLTDVMFAISFLGADFTLGAATLVLIILAWRHYKKEAFLFSSVLAMTLAINLFLKDLIQRPRPELAPLVDLTNSYSFPSGHAMNAFAFYSLLSYFAFHFTRKKKFTIVISFFALILILLVGVSRVYLGVHYPSDVIAGFIAGFWVFVTGVLIERTVAFFRLFKG